MNKNSEIMKNFIQLTIMLSVPVILFLNPVFAQSSGKVAADNVQKTVLLDEVKAILADQDNAVIVRAILGKKNGSELRRGDVIFMAQGLPVSSVSDLISLYEKTGKKQEFRMAVKRNDEKFLTSFDIDPKSETGREMFTGTMSFNSTHVDGGSSTVSDVIPDLLVYGIMAAGSDDGLIIKKTMPNLDSRFKEKKIKEGDKIVSVAGKKVKTHKMFKQVWDKISEGEMVDLNILQDGKEISVPISKKDVNGKVIFKQDG